MLAGAADAAAASGDGRACLPQTTTAPPLPLPPGAMAHAVRADMESGTEEPEPSELFSDLGTLVVEGRMPGGQRGFHEGPHCVLVYPYRQNKHVCDANSAVCQRESELRRYMYLLWRNNIPMSVEVLLCPPCAHGRSRAAAVDAAPEPGYLLLEQWTVHMETATRCQRSAVGARSLLQAVYSYLHFSQLSAWYSRSAGAAPGNVMYRITVPGDAFGTRFAGGPPQLHTFPTAYLARDRTLVQVSVRTLPRCDAVPAIPCGACQAGEADQALGACAAPLPGPAPAYGASAALDAATDQWSADDLRRSIIKCRLQGALSDSRDSLLGDSLLDPPRSLHKYPKRYQSPSRSGSPSLETPEHLMFGGSRESSAERRTERRADLSRRVITDQCAAPDLAWTQGRATWRPDSSPPPQSDDPRPELYRHRRSPSREDRRGHFYDLRRAPPPPPPLQPPQSQPPGRRSPLDDRGSKDAHRSPRQSRRSYKDEYRVPQDGEYHRVPRDGERSAEAVEEEARYSQRLQGPESVRRRSPQRSRSDCSSVFRLTPDETQQVVAVLRRPVPPPSSGTAADNPLLLAIERAGQAGVRSPQRAAQFLARTEPVSTPPGGLARPLHSPGRDGARLVRLVRRALSFEHQPEEAAATRAQRAADGGAIPRLEAPVSSSAAEGERVQRGAERWTLPSNGCAEDGGEERTESGECEIATFSNGSSQFSNGSCERVSNGSSERFSNGSCERVSNGEKVSNGSCERVSNGTCDRISNGASEKVSNGNSESYLNRPSVSNGVGSRTADVSQVENGTSALNKKGSRSLKSNNLIKRLFKKEEPEPEDEEVETRQKPETPPNPASVRRSLDSAGPGVFSQKTGLPLNSSPAPLRRGSAFHFDAALTKVKTFSSALKELSSESTDADGESSSPSSTSLAAGRQLSASCPAGVISSLLGSFEESVLNGRLGPVSTVQGFSADIGASGSFQPKHVRLPVTVFFYSLSDNEKIASPYMGHVHLGKKGYHVPKKGTLQVTLFNPHGTVVKMFVVMYDLSSMPAGCQTFLRQRTLYMPVGESPEHPNSQKWLRYLIHLRFATGRTGRVYVHTDLRMIIFRKSDMDAAAVHTSDSAAHEMRSFVHMPDNPRYSPRK